MTTFVAGEVWTAETIEGLLRHNRRLVDENLKLREYVVASERCSDYIACQKSGKGGEEHCPMLSENGMCKLSDTARELGIGD